MRPLPLRPLDPTRARQRLSTLRWESVLTLAVVSGAVLFVFSQLQPALILSNTTPSGGDMGAHVWGPAYLRDTLLPNLRITGWAPAWYAGFPAFHFYFPLPALAIVALDLVLPYGVAFKLVTVSGVVAMPAAAWAFGRLSGMRFPGPALLAAAMVPFLFDRGFTIYGGNIASTLAGEYSFSISLSFALVFLGLVARGLDTGRSRALAGMVLACTGLCHLLPTVFAVVGAVLLLLLRPGRRRALFLGTVLAVGALLAAFWSVPFLFRMPYANNMGWEKITKFSENLFPPKLQWLVVMAGVGAIVSLALRRRTGLFLVGMAAIAAAFFVLAPQGRLWNARVLPFWYLCLYLLAGVAVAEGGAVVAKLVAKGDERRRSAVVLATPVAGALAVWMFVGLPLGVVPSFVPQPETTDASFIPSWAKWNYSGYEGKTAYPEYKAIVDTMAKVGRARGCGRAHWEYESAQDRFGTPMALMLLPYWTDGCIGSMEGLYFESSATVPYHFLSAGELSKAPSNPMRDLPYRGLDLVAGIRHLQLMGSKYYLAFSPETVAQADVHPDLELVGSTGQWRVYEVAGAELVEPLATVPAVVTGVKSGERPWLDLSVNWFMGLANANQEVMLAESGPKEWPRVALEAVPTATLTVGSGYSVEAPPVLRPAEPATVSNIVETNDGISFDVDRVGQPVLVKVSYFPNWKADGADGPWRVTPNLMVVVPTSEHVELRYGYTPPDVAGWLLTFGGIGAAVVLRRRGAADVADVRRVRRPVPAVGPGAADGGLVEVERTGQDREPVPTRGG